MTDSCGRRSNSARATVSPPIPESNTPSGALFIHRDAHADPARERVDFEIGGEIAQVGRDVGFGTREEMIEDPEDEPVLHLLALEPEVFRVNLLKVVRFLLRLERHHGRYAFPGHKRRTRHRPPRGRLAPSRIFTCVPRMTRGMATRNRGSETRRIKQTSSFPSAGSASGAKR